LVAALVAAIAGFQMPYDAALASAGFGAAFGLVPIGWIVLAAVFLYHLTVRSGQFEVVKRSVAAISPDRRMQALLIAFSFGAFLEGAAGFGTPVAISAALMIGLGFRPLYAAGLALIANTSPVAFGALGTPIITLAKVSVSDPQFLAQWEMALSQMAGRQLPFFSPLIPAWIILVMAGWKGLRGAWPAVLVCGGSCGVIQFLTSNFHGPSLAGVSGGVGSMIALAVFLRYWQPAEVWKFPDEAPAPQAAEEPPLTRRQVAYAWVPWIVLSLMVFVWGIPVVKNVLATGQLSSSVPHLDGRIYRTAPVVPVAPDKEHADKPEEVVFRFNWLGETGTGIFLAAVISAIWLRTGAKDFARQFAETAYKVRWAVFTIACMLALAYVTKFSGADATLGLAFTRSGWLYPFFAPMLGWLGVALTGSDTSSNALFGSLQRITAEQLGLNPVLIVASNSTGGVMGKMIDAQSIVVAAVATEQPGREGEILRFVFWHSLILAVLIGLLTLAQAYWLDWMIPVVAC
jgi:lactate permease